MSYDPYEHLDDEARNDFEVRQHLWAKRRLADTVDTKAKVAKMLAEVKPGPKVCNMLISRDSKGEDGQGKAKTTPCGKPGTRMLALTGDWTCAEHDPLRREHHRCEACERHLVVEQCEHRDGAWRCSVPFIPHDGAHIHMTLEG